MLSPKDVPNLFDKIKLQNEISVLQEKIKYIDKGYREARAIEKIDNALRRGVTKIGFSWFGSMDINTLVKIEFLYKDKGWNVDSVVGNFWNYLVFKP